MMGPSKPPLSDAPLRPTTQLYRSEAKSLQTQVLFDFFSSADVFFICDYYKKMSETHFLG